MRRLPGAAPLVGQDHDAPRRVGIDLDIAALPLAALARHALPLSADGWRTWARRYGVPLDAMPEVLRRQA